MEEDDEDEDLDDDRLDAEGVGLRLAVLTVACELKDAEIARLRLLAETKDGVIAALRREVDREKRIMHGLIDGLVGHGGADVSQASRENEDKT